MRAYGITFRNSPERTVAAPSLRLALEFAVRRENERHPDADPVDLDDIAMLQWLGEFDGIADPSDLCDWKDQHGDHDWKVSEEGDHRECRRCRYEEICDEGSWGPP